MKSADEVGLEEQILLDEAIDELDQYFDLDPGIYEPPTTQETTWRAEYKRQARKWERRVVESKACDSHESLAEQMPEPKRARMKQRAKRELYRSEWKRALWQAVVNRGLDASYQEIATWIAETLPETDLPKYCANKKDSDLSLLVRHEADVRNQFKRDLNKIKADLRKDGQSGSTAAVSS